MNRKLLMLVVLTVCFVAGMRPLYAELKLGSKAPNFSLKVSDEKAVQTLEDYRGKNIVFVNFFATWCENCQEEMATLKQINEKYKDQGLLLISVNVQERPEKVRKFIEKYQLSFPVLLDADSKVAKQYGLVGFPYNFIIDGNGDIKFMDSRPPKNFEKLFSDLKATLKPANSSPGTGAVTGA